MQPPGYPIPVNLTRDPTEDSPPVDDKIRRAVIKRHSGGLEGATRMRAKCIKAWLLGIEQEEKVVNDGEEGH